MISQQTWVERNFSRLLMAIAAAGLIPCLVYANFQFLEFDGWWHLFTATQDRWLILIGEWKYIAHPPLLYPLLRVVAKFSESHLAIRLIGITCGAAGSYVMGVTAAKIYRHKISALLAAAAYTFAWSMIEINCDVRGYPLAILFILLTFNAYLDWLRDPGSRRAIVRFGIYSLLAILSEYYVIFFLAGCAGIVALRAITQPDFRAAFLGSIRGNVRAWLFAIVSPAVLFAVLFLFHMRNQPPVQYYIQSYYFDENSPLGLDGFLVSNLEKEIGFFTPFGIDPVVMFAVAGLMLGALIYFGFVRKGRWQGPKSADSPLMLGILLAQLLVLALAARYPFGGEWRHQSIIAPFVFLTAFLVLDRIADALNASRLRNAAFALVGILIASSFAYGWTVYPWDPVDPLTAEYQRFHAMFPTPETVYGDGTSLVFFYSQTHRSKWIFEDRFLIDEQRIAVYKVDDGSGHPIRILKNKREVYFDLAKPETYQTLADVLRHENLKSAVLFYEGLHWNPEGAKILEEKFKALAPLAGLDYGKYSLGTSYAFVEFTLR